MVRPSTGTHVDSNSAPSITAGILLENVREVVGARRRRTIGSVPLAQRSSKAPGAFRVVRVEVIALVVRRTLRAADRQDALVVVHVERGHVDAQANVEQVGLEAELV